MSFKRPIQRLRNTSLALEPRMLYDGAALVDVTAALDHDTDADIAGASKESADTQATSAVKDLLLGLESTSAETRDAAQLAEQAVKSFMDNHTNAEIFEIFNGGQSEASAEWLARLDALRSEIATGEFHIRVANMESASVSGGVAAFVADGPNGEPVIAVNAGWANLLGSDGMSRILAEEIGHALDYRLNGAQDTAGDEGALFAAKVFADQLSDSEVSDIKTERDAGQVVIDGQSYAAEFANFAFVGAYELVYDLNNNNVEDTNTENWSDIETSSYFFDSSSEFTSVSVTDGQTGPDFSGNNVPVKLTLTASGASAATVLYGTITRPIKIGNTAVAFYFWADIDQTTVPTENSDDLTGPADNRGFILVVSQSGFESIVTTATSTTNINNSKDGNLGDIYLSEVGSSSDPVASALNAVQPVNTVAEVYEEGLADGTNPSSTSETTSGSLTLQSKFSIATQQTGETDYGTWTVNTNGTFTYTLKAGVDSTAITSDTFFYTASEVDNKGNVTATAVNTVTVVIVDDAPTISATAPTKDLLQVDETDLTTDDSADLGVDVGSIFAVTAGADGQDSLAYFLSLSDDGVNSGLVDTATGTSVYLYRVDDVTIKGVVGLNGTDIAFQISLSEDGDGHVHIQLDQRRALSHGDTSTDNEALYLASGVLFINATVTDGDGDSSTAQADIGGNGSTGSGAISFLDDGPAISGSTTGLTGANGLRVDETTLGTSESLDLSGAFDTTSSGLGAGADGQDSLTYALALDGSNVSSGVVDTATGQTVYMNLENGVIIARVGTGTAGAEAFRLTVNTDAGNVTLTQFRALVHANGDDPNDVLYLSDSGKLTLRATLTDNDGDTASDDIALGGNDGVISFADDGPALTKKSVAIDTLTVSDSDYATDASANFADNFNAAVYGADGAGSVTYALELSADGIGSGLFALGTSGAAGSEILLSQDATSGVISGSVGAIEYFTISIDASTGVVTFNQKAAIYHDQTTHNTSDALAIDAGDGTLLLRATAADKDGDEASQTIDLGANGAFVITDDAPSITTTAAGAGVLTVDETNIDGATAATSGAVDLSGLFTVDTGNDGQLSLTYALSSAADGTDSGLVDTETSQAVKLYTVSGDVVGKTATGGVEVFRISVDASSGEVTLTQSRAMVHPTAGSTAAAHDEAIKLASGLVSLSATVTDKDGDEDTQSIDLGGSSGAISFKDDGPSIAASSAAIPDMSVDDSDFNTDASADFASNFSAADYGSDGAGTTTYALELTGSGVSSGLYAVAAGGGQGAEILLNQDPDTGVITGSAGGLNYFTIFISSGSTVEFDQLRAIYHSQGGDSNPNDVSTLSVASGALVMRATATDEDGDTASATIDLGTSGKFKVYDDASTLSTTAPTSASLQVDETNLSVDKTADLSSSFTLSHASADGQKSLVYALGVTDGTDSGVVDTATGNAVMVYQVDSTHVEGRVGGSSGEVAFALSVSSDGKVTLDQQRALEHPTGGASHDEAITLGAGVVSLSATVTDKDGDTDTESVDLGNTGGAISFKDDGPSAALASSPAAVELALDESNTRSLTKSFANYFSSATEIYGQDGEGSLAYALSLNDGGDAGVDSGLFAYDDTDDVGQGAAILLFDNNGVIEGRVGASDGDHYFSISVDSTGKVTFALETGMNVWHPYASASDVPGDVNLSLTDDALALTQTVTDADGDTDTVTKSLNEGDFSIAAHPAPITVTGGTYNEASSHAVFTVTANPGQYLTLDVVDNADTGKNATGSEVGTGDDLNNSPVYYSVDGGTTWVLYDGTPFAAGSQDVLVAVDIGNEQDTQYEGEEQVQLVVNTGSTTEADGFSSIVDDGTGKKWTYDPEAPGTPPAELTGPSQELDDDRPLSVNDITVNEGSEYGVFEVSGGAGQYVKLELQDGTAGDADYGPDLEYFDGTQWQPYTPGDFIQLDGNGKVLVRTPILDDNIYEKSETFKLKATNTGDTSGTGTAKIVDDGTGSKWTFEEPANADDPVTDPGTKTTSPGAGSNGYDDDRPIFEIDDVTVTEGTDSSITFTVTKVFTKAGGSSIVDSSVDYQTVNGTAIAGLGKDYASKTGTLNFGASEATKIITTAIVDDNQFEPTETFTVKLSGSTDAIVDDTVRSANGTGTILDDDQGELWVDVESNSPVQETEDWAEFVVRGSPDLEVELSVRDKTTSLTTESQPKIQYRLTPTGAWLDYDPENRPKMVDGQGVLYVRVDITAEQEPLPEGTERFELVASIRDYSRPVGQDFVRDIGQTDILDPVATPLEQPPQPPEPEFEPAAPKNNVDAYVLAAVKEAREELSANALADAMDATAQATIDRLSGSLALHVLPAVNEARTDTLRSMERMFGQGNNSFVRNEAGVNTVFGVLEVSTTAPAAAPVSGAGAPVEAAVFDVPEADAKAQERDDGEDQDKKDKKEKPESTPVDDAVPAFFGAADQNGAHLFGQSLAAQVAKAQKSHQSFSDQLRSAQSDQRLAENRATDAASLAADLELIAI